AEPVGPRGGGAPGVGALVGELATAPAPGVKSRPSPNAVLSVGAEGTITDGGGVTLHSASGCADRTAYLGATATSRTRHPAAAGRSGGGHAHEGGAPSGCGRRRARRTRRRARRSPPPLASSWASSGRRRTRDPERNRV